MCSGWAAGKCELGGSQPTVFADQEVSGDGSGEALAPADPEAAKIAAALAAADEQARRELNARVLAAEQQLAAAKADLEASLSREATLQGHLTDAQKLNEAAAGELEKVRGQVADLGSSLLRSPKRRQPRNDHEHASAAVPGFSPGRERARVPLEAAVARVATAEQAMVDAGYDSHTQILIQCMAVALVAAAAILVAFPAKVLPLVHRAASNTRMATSLPCGVRWPPWTRPALWPISSAQTLQPQRLCSLSTADCRRRPNCAP
jgi:hypothetical protein